jgi:hypothetical protein
MQELPLATTLSEACDQYLAIVQGSGLEDICNPVIMRLAFFAGAAEMHRLEGDARTPEERLMLLRDLTFNVLKGSAG